MNDYLMGKYAIQLNDAQPLIQDPQEADSLLFRYQTGDTWHVLTLAWQGSEQWVMLDGVVIGQRFDSLLTVAHALTLAEHQALVESQAPVFAKTSVFQFRPGPEEEEAI